MRRRVAALAAAACIAASVGHGQAVPEFFPFGEFEVGLDVIGFGQDDILSVERFMLDDLHAVKVTLSPQLDTAFAAATRGKVGYQMTMRVCGHAVTMAVLQAELNVATVVITTGDAAKAEAAYDLLRRPPCSDL
jgi:hypothetical protein